jgi:hypothetical protein
MFELASTADPNVGRDLGLVEISLSPSFRLDSD